MVLPESPAQRWEVKVNVTFNFYSSNVYLDIIVVQNGDFGSPDSGFGDSKISNDMIQCPKPDREPDPDLVAPAALVSRELVPNM